MPQSGRAIVMQRLLEICKFSTVADIMRAAMFLEQAAEVRKGNRSNRTGSRQLQATASKRKAAKQDNPMAW